MQCDPAKHGIAYCSTTNISKTEQNGYHFAENIFKYIFFIKIFLIIIQISLNFISESNWKKSALIQVTAGHQTRGKQLFESMLIQYTDTYMSPGLNELNLQKTPQAWPYAWGMSWVFSVCTKSKTAHKLLTVIYTHIKVCYQHMITYKHHLRAVMSGTSKLQFSMISRRLFFQLHPFSHHSIVKCRPPVSSSSYWWNTPPKLDWCGDHS